MISTRATRHADCSMMMLRQHKHQVSRHRVTSPSAGRAPPSMDAVIATTSASMRRTDGKTSACSGFVWLNSVYASFSSCRCCGQTETADHSTVGAILLALNEQSGCVIAGDQQLPHQHRRPDIRPTKLLQVGASDHQTP